MRRVLASPLALPIAVACLLGPLSAHAAPIGAHLLPEKGKVVDARLVHVGADAGASLVLLVLSDEGVPHLVLHRAGAVAAPKRWFHEEARHERSLGETYGAVGAIAVGRFPGNAVVRLYDPEGWIDLDASLLETSRVRPPEGCLLGRSVGQPIAFWDGVGDLDGDGIDESWHPAGAGAAPGIVVRGDGKRHVLALPAMHHASSDGIEALRQEVSYARLEAADMDGDGRRELCAIAGDTLLSFSLPAAGGADAATLEPTRRIVLPFLAEAEKPQPGTIRTARLQLADVNRDGAADLLVTMISGRSDRIGSLKTLFFHYAGPLGGTDGGAPLGSPRARIDTPSVMLHPAFEDLDGDGLRDYVGDSIRDTNLVTLAMRMAGNDPELTLEAFRFDGTLGTFAPAPMMRAVRAYPSAQALGNTFHPNTFFGTDLDGDGRRDLLDLGNLRTVSVWAATLEPAAAGGMVAVAYTRALLGPLPVGEGLVPAARFGDLNGDRRADAVLFGKGAVYLLTSASEPK